MTESHVRSQGILAATPARPLVLQGDFHLRGCRQAVLEPEMQAAVIAAVLPRVEAARPAIDAARDYLSRQWDFTAHHASGQLEWIKGIAEGFGIRPMDLFAYLHLGTIEDADIQPPALEDGCSVVAKKLDGVGPALAKNRDYRGEHKALQRVFLDEDPAWGERRILSVGSLGSPGAFSSGINSDGLALADTHIGWLRPGIGWLRYLLMNEILINAANVPEALDLVESRPHVGGGSLVIADAAGCMAAVELGSKKVMVSAAAGRGIAQTNHFLDPQLAEMQTRHADDPASMNSSDRLRQLDAWLDTERANGTPLDTMARLLAGHPDGTGAALCRHGGDNGSTTISTTLFACKSRRLYFCPGNPCSEPWRVFEF
jgi:isopenicillin-N N-acyltransferase like protein